MLIGKLKEERMKSEKKKSSLDPYWVVGFIGLYPPVGSIQHMPDEKRKREEKSAPGLGQIPV